jgi:hypothetical protein
MCSICGRGLKPRFLLNRKLNCDSKYQPHLPGRKRPVYAEEVDLVVAGIAVVAFAATVFMLARAGARLGRGPARSVADASAEEWMTPLEVAEMLDVPEADVLTLVERDAIPYYVLSTGGRGRPSEYRFRRHEIEAWTIG